MRRKKKTTGLVIRSILISAKSIAGIDFFSIFAQSALENSTVLLSPSEGYTQGAARVYCESPWFKRCVRPTRDSN